MSFLFNFFLKKIPSTNYFDILMQEKRVQNFTRIRGNCIFHRLQNDSDAEIFFHTHPISSPNFPTQKRIF